MSTAGSLVWDLEANADVFEDGIKNASKQVNKLGSETESISNKISNSMKKAGDSSNALGSDLLKIGALPTAALATASFSAINFEDVMADVAKTTGLSGQALSDFSSDLIEASRNTRTSVTDLAAIAEIGGQLGIATKDLSSFTETINIFNVALGKDFSGGVEEAATKVGKLTSLFDETKKLDIADGINKTGSAINYLGSVGAGTTANIVDFATRMGQLPGALKPSIQDSLALGTLLEETGITAEIASGGLTNFFLTAGNEIDGFATQMGMTTQKARELLNTDPTAFATKFALSVKDLDAVALANTLGTLKIGTQETIKVIGSLGQGTTRLAELQKGANTEFSKGTSLLNEYNVKNNTTGAEMEKMKNMAIGVGITLGTVLLPAINDILTSLTPVVIAFAEFAKDKSGLVTGILTVGTAIGGLGLAFKVVGGVLSFFSGPIGLLLKELPLLKNIAITLGTAIAGISAPVWIAIGVITALVAIGVLLYKNWDKVKEVGIAVFNYLKEKIGDFSNWVGNIFIKIGGGTGVITSLIAAGVLLYKNWDKVKEVGASAFGYLKEKIGDFANWVSGVFGRIGEAIQSINPFHRNSPSLVDNVQNGLALIKKEYASMGSINLPVVADSFPTMGSIGMEDSTATSPNSNVNVNIENVNNVEDVDMIAREIGFRLSIL